MLIQAENLHVGYRSGTGTAWAVKNFSLAATYADSVGIVGESGSGKSTAALALMGLLTHRRDCVVKGDVFFEGRSLLREAPAGLRKLWGDRMSMVFQDPMSALNPVMRIEEQILELVRCHRRMDKKKARDLAITWFNDVGLPDPQNILRRYPHQLSGGQLQRVMIAMALICEPDVIFADEPTTALDLTIQSQILSILTRLCADFGVTLVLVTHDLAVVAETTRYTIVMYSGSIVEQGKTEDVLGRPQHPYTRGLIAAMPRIETGTQRLPAIAGAPMTPSAEWSGCRFAPRCPMAEEICQKSRPGMAATARENLASHAAACHFAQ